MWRRQVKSRAGRADLIADLIGDLIAQDRPSRATVNHI